MDKIIQLLPMQTKFMDSEARFPAMISAIATGKTFVLLSKIWRFCETYPDSLALVVRKTFTDLRDSTMRDFERYFNAQIDSNKEFHFPNGSALMFRHGDEISTLKNVNLSIFGIEQAEEFATDETFIFLRDRLRRDNSPYRQGIIVANAAGRNWVYNLWVAGADRSDIDTDTGQYQYLKGEYDCYTANTFANEKNLPADFIKDLRLMEKDSPNHYKQYVLNSFDDLLSDDLLLTGELVYNSPKLEFTLPRGRVLGVDVARFGEDESVFCIIENKNLIKFEQIHQETWKNKDLMQVVGKIIDMAKTFRVDSVVVDDTGMGGGVTDRLGEMRINVMPFVSAAKAGNSEKYANKRSEGYFRLQELFHKGYIKILPDGKLQEQLLSIRFKYNSSGQKLIVSKDEMRKEGLKSPDRADALMYACYFKDQFNDITRNSGYIKNRMRESERLYREWDPFREAGIP